jgi:hypothetical protein
MRPRAWTESLDNPSTASAISAITAAIGAASAYAGRSQASPNAAPTASGRSGLAGDDWVLLVHGPRPGLTSAGLGGMTAGAVRSLGHQVGKGLGAWPGAEA